MINIDTPSIKLKSHHSILKNQVFFQNVQERLLWSRRKNVMINLGKILYFSKKNAIDYLDYVQNI